MKPILVTRPICTPRYFTAEPTSRPWTDSSKYVSIVTVRLKAVPAPSARMIATRIAEAAMMKIPSRK